MSPVYWLLTLAAAPMVTGPSTLTAAPSSTPSPAAVTRLKGCYRLTQLVVCQRMLFPGH